MSEAANRGPTGDSARQRRAHAERKKHICVRSASTIFGFQRRSAERGSEITADVAGGVHISPVLSLYPTPHPRVQEHPKEPARLERTNDTASKRTKAKRSENGLPVPNFRKKGIHRGLRNALKGGW